MALGFPIGSADGGGGGDFLPVVKFDARSGRISKTDKTMGSDPIVTELKQFSAIFDMENIECGWMRFATGMAPSLYLVRLGEVWPDQPDSDHKRGIRVVVKLSKANGGDIRELCGNSASFLRGFDALHTAYEAGKAANAGKLPVVTLQDTVAVISKGGKQNSTNYEPIWAITAWVPRPPDFVPNLRGGSAVTTIATPRAAPPSTGATQVKAPALSDEDADEFV